jgi:2,3,4,5-tetrahydropyridine-2-carboxylate N-succinyltransferase
MRAEIERAFQATVPPPPGEIRSLLSSFRAALNRGSVRAAEIVDGKCQVHAWVKMGILLHARAGALVDASPFGDGTCFDYDTLPARRFSPGDSVRIPAGGSTIRDGAYLGHGVVCMPPCIVNIGAWIGEGTSIDSHVTIGVCAQIGAHVRISCGTNIGGVIEPLDAVPAIVSDHVVIGGNCGLYDGVFVGEGAILGAGTILSGMSRVYDFQNKRMFRAGQGQPLMIPPLSIVVPGARPISKGAAEGSGLLLQVPVIVGTRDQVDVSQDFLDDLMA